MSKEFDQRKAVATGVNLDEMRSLLEMLEKHDVSEFSLERRDEKISLKRGKVSEDNSQKAPYFVSPQFVASSPMFAPAGASPAIAEKAPVDGQTVAAKESQEAAVAETTEKKKSTASVSKKVAEVVSPMVGTFYRRPAIDASPYVSVGDTVKKGDVLCIVEAMKLMNEIQSDYSGRIAEICLEDGQMVEYGETLFRIEAL